MESWQVNGLQGVWNAGRQRDGVSREPLQRLAWDEYPMSRIVRPSGRRQRRDKSFKIPCSLREGGPLGWAISSRLVNGPADRGAMIMADVDPDRNLLLKAFAIRARLVTQDTLDLA